MAMASSSARREALMNRDTGIGSSALAVRIRLPPAAGQMHRNAGDLRQGVSLSLADGYGISLHLPAVAGRTMMQES